MLDEEGAKERRGREKTLLSIKERRRRGYKQKDFLFLLLHSSTTERETSTCNSVDKRKQQNNITVNKHIYLS
jgi:hypothetical protein